MATVHVQVNVEMGIGPMGVRGTLASRDIQEKEYLAIIPHKIVYEVWRTDDTSPGVCLGSQTPRQHSAATWAAESSRASAHSPGWEYHVSSIVYTFCSRWPVICTLTLLPPES
jgi:hypothetical protein